MTRKHTSAGFARRTQLRAPTIGTEQEQNKPSDVGRLSDDVARSRFDHGANFAPCPNYIFKIKGKEMVGEWGLEPQTR